MSPFAAAVPSFAALLSGGAGAGPVDPLAGIAYRLRFETTWDKVTLRPMWQDVARTIPVTGEGDLMATGGPEDAEFVPAQPDGAKQGMLLLAADGTPYIDFDGVDDIYPIGTAGGTVVYTALIRSKTSTFDSYWGVVETMSTAVLNDRWGLFEGGSTQFGGSPAPQAVRRDAVDLVAPYDCAPIDDWFVITVTTNAANVTARALFQLDEIYHVADAELIACFMHDGIPSDADRNAVEAFYATLKPAP